MTEIFVINYDDFVEKHGDVDFPNDYFYDLEYEDLEKLCEEGIAEYLNAEEFEQQFNSGEYSGSGLYIRIFEIAEYNEKQKRKRIAELAFKIFIAPPDPNCGVIDTKAAFRVAEKFYEYEQKYLNGEINNEKD